MLRFTFVMGPLSSLFDIATFALLRLWFDAGVEVFRTAWFLEFMATQILVIFLICTVRPAWTSTPHLFLTATSLAALGSALLLTLTPFGAFLGFVLLPSTILCSHRGVGNRLSCCRRVYQAACYQSVEKSF